MQLRIIFFTGLLLTFFGLFAQSGQIEGLLTADENELPFATLHLKNTEYGTTTDLNGKYQLKNIPPGNYTLIASFVGYISEKKSIQLNAGQTLTVNFKLVSSSTLEEIVVTGTMKETYVSASPIKIDVVTSDQLDTYLPSAASSVVESVQLVNGVQEVVACGVCYTNNISVNGLPGSYTAILMDGTPIYGSLASVYGLNGIPNMIIDRFEVIKGPSSTLYGSEAVAGVINIITKNPEVQPAVSIDLMTSSHEEVFGNIAMAPRLGRSNAYVGVNFGYANHYADNNFDGFGDGINSDHVSVFSKINFYRPSDKIFSLAAKYYYEDRRNGVEAYVKDRAYKELRGNNLIYGESIYTNRAELFGTYALDTKANLKIDYSLSNHDQDSYYGDQYFEASQQIAFGNFLWNFYKSKHDVLIGATLRYDAYDDNTMATEEEIDGVVINTPNNQFVPGVFAQDEYSFSENFTILGGLRVDHHQEHGLIYAPRLNLKAKTSDWTTFRFNFGTGFKVVNLFTEDHAFVTGQREVFIAEELEPESSYNFSLNYNQVYTGLGGSGSIDLEAFYTHFTNKIIPDYDTPGRIIYENSDGFAKTMGLGLNLNHNFKFPFSLNMGLNLLESTETDYSEDGEEITTDIPFAPKWSGVITANYELRRQKITLAYSAQFTGVMALPEVYDLDAEGIPLEDPRPITSKPFSIHQIQISKLIKNNYNLYFGVNNLFNFIQTESPLVGYDDPNFAPGFSPYFDTAYAYAPNHGIEIYLGFKWDLAKKPKLAVVALEE
ncbi:TonB-dependent receptor [Lutimonas zeaxanthinifaciens]|uniref:TonB-dependent receptor n=1 Tax=Lutimonas zeaxanthinifaciens TaxID=3060215 RepID=UPI00265D5D7B|nr:TonB-dependent receptor [Lutimonas sp. YSD2104]WKK64886.1 TonB-dependent receptor [Lutimonas sp. YSD2104]